MTVRTPPQTSEAELYLPERPITEEYYAKLPDGALLYELRNGRLLLKNYTGCEELRCPDRPVTAELFMEIPEGPPYYQLIEGLIVMSPTPTFYHQRILMRLGTQIEVYLEGHPIGQCAMAPCDVKIEGGSVYEPDLFFIRKGNPHVAIERTVAGPPDLVVEILSPSNFRADRIAKRPAYARSGVGEMWIIDPKLRQIEVYNFAQGLETAPTIICEPNAFLPELFPGLLIDTARLFKPLE